MAQKTLTQQQIKFVNYYCEYENGSLAAKKAGYSTRHPSQSATLLLKSPLIQKEIVKVRAQIRREKEAEDPDLVVEYVPPVYSHIEVTMEMVVTELWLSIKEARHCENMSAAMKGFELLGRHLGMFVDKSEQNVTITHEEWINALIEHK